MSTHNMFSSRNEALLMSTHNKCFRQEIRKVSILFSIEKSTLSGAVVLGCMLFKCF